MDEPMDVDSNMDEHFSTKSKHMTPQRRLHDFQSNKENAVNPNISYEDLDVSEVNMRLRMSTCTPMASPAVKGDGRRHQMSSSVMSKSFDVSIADMSIDEADTTIVLNSTKELLGNTSENTTIQLPEDDQVGSHVECNIVPPVQTKEPLKVMNNERSHNTSLHVNIENKNFPETNINASSPIIRGLKSVINMFRTSQSPIPQSSSPRTDDNIICLSDSSNPSPITAKAITISDDDEPKLQKEIFADETSNSASLYPQTFPISNQVKKEEKENSRSSTSESVVFKEEFINDLKWNDDSTIIFNTRKSSQNVRLSSSLSESPCDLEIGSETHSFTNEWTEHSSELVNESKSHTPTSPEKDTSKIVFSTELTELKHSDDIPNTQNTTEQLNQFVESNNPNSTVNLENPNTICEAINKSTTMELDPNTNIFQNVAASLEFHLNEEILPILSETNNTCVDNCEQNMNENCTNKVHTDTTVASITKIESDIDKYGLPQNIPSVVQLTGNGKNNLPMVLDPNTNKFQNVTAESSELNLREEISPIISETNNTNVDNCDQKLNENCTNEVHTDTTFPSLTTIECGIVQYGLPQNIPSIVQFTGTDENNLPMKLDIPEYFIQENVTPNILSEEDLHSDAMLSLVAELDTRNKTVNEKKNKTASSYDLNSENNFEIVENVTPDDEKLQPNFEDSQTTNTNAILSVEQSSSTKDSTTSTSKMKAKGIIVDVTNESQTLDDSIYESANSESQEHIEDSRKPYVPCHKYDIPSSHEPDILNLAENNNTNNVSVVEPIHDTYEDHPITLNEEIKTSEVVKSLYSNRAESPSVPTDTYQQKTQRDIETDYNVIKTDIIINKKESVDFDYVENPFATITRVRTSPEPVSPNFNKNMTVEQPQSPMEDSHINIQDKSLNISNDVAHDVEKSSFQSPPTEDAILKSTVSEPLTYDIVNKTEMNCNIENPFVTKTKIRDSFSPSEECVAVDDTQFDSIEDAYTPKLSTEAEALSNEISIKGDKTFDDSKEPVSLPKKCNYAGQKTLLLKTETVAHGKQFDTIENPLVLKTKICDSSSLSKECNNVDNIFDSTGDLFVVNSKIEDLTKLCKVENIQNELISKSPIQSVNSIHSVSPSKELIDKANILKLVIGKLQEDHKEIRDTNEKQLYNIKNPFATNSNIRDSANCFREHTEAGENLSAGLSENPLVTKCIISESPSPSYEGTDAVAKPFGIIEEPHVIKSKIEGLDTSHKELRHSGFETFADNPTDKGIIDPSNTFGMIQGNLQSTNDEMTELDRSIEEEFLPGELFANPDAFDYFMSRTNKNESLEKGKESLFLKFDPLYSKNINSEGVVSSLANLSRNRISVGQTAIEEKSVISEDFKDDEFMNNTITIDSSDDDIGDKTFVANTEVAKDEMNRTITVSNSTFHAHHDPSKVELISDVSVINRGIHNQTFELNNDLDSNSSSNGMNSTFTKQLVDQTLVFEDLRTIDRNDTIINPVQNGTSNTEPVHSHAGIEGPKDDGPNKKVLGTAANNLTMTHYTMDKVKEIIDANSTDKTLFIEASSEAQATCLTKQTVQNTFTILKDTTKMMDNTTTLQHSFNNTFDKLTSSVTDKPTLMVSPAINSGKMNTPIRLTPLSIDREIASTPVSPAMAVINRLIFERTTPTSLSHNTHVDVEHNRPNNQLSDTTSALYQHYAGDEYNQLRYETRVLVDKIADFELKVKNLTEDNAEKMKNNNHLQKKLSEKISENKNMATVVEEYERTISQLISEREADMIKQAEERCMLVRERDEQTEHLTSMEQSFNDLHTKYERSKVIVLRYRNNEETLKNTIAANEVNFRKLEGNYNLLQQHATAKLSDANEELDKIKKQYHAEILKLNALVKRKEMLASSLQESLAQEKKNNEQLTAICDELINKVG